MAGYIIFDNDKIRLILAKFHLVEGQDLHNEQFHKLEIYHKSLWCFKIFRFFEIQRKTVFEHSRQKNIFTKKISRPGFEPVREPLKAATMTPTPKCLRQ